MAHNKLTFITNNKPNKISSLLVVSLQSICEVFLKKKCLFEIGVKTWIEDVVLVQVTWPQSLLVLIR